MVHVTWRGVSAVATLAACAVFTPVLSIAVCLVVLACQLALGLLHATSVGRGTSDLGPARRAPKVGNPPVFTVHVPACNEPPEVLIATLESLALQERAPEHEVIVLDNNTADPALWGPVSEWCRSREGFRFFHVEGVRGAKAGALNIATARSRPDATHVVVVDADYRVAPDFLAHAAEALGTSGADFVQFPQAYLAEENVVGAALEFSDYFRRHASVANDAGAMLLTGTLSVVSLQALRNVGGWRADTVTEDAELGLRLSRNGYTGRYVDLRVGRGLLPFDWVNLHRQRSRWAAGNVRTLRLGLSGMPRERMMLVISQLTAWANLGAVFAALLAGAGLAGVLAGPEAGAHRAALVDLCVLGLALCYLSTLTPLVLAAQREAAGARALIESAAMRAAMVPSSAAATLDALIGAKPGFVITAKRPGALDGGVPAPALAWALAATPLFLPPLGLVDALGAALLMLPLLAGLHTDRRLREYAQALSPARAGI